MTASGVELLSSCRVQLVGLPQSAATSNGVVVVGEGVSGSSSIIRRSAMPSTMLPLSTREADAPRRVSRNLFGSPQPGEVRELLHKETLQQRSYILKRYNFDILSPPEDSVDTLKLVTTKNEPVRPTTHRHHKCQQQLQLPGLIAKESLNHEKRLQQQQQQQESSERGVGLEECNLSRTPNSELPSSLISLKKSGQVRRTVGTAAVITSAVVDKSVGGDKLAPVLVTQNMTSERLKPYTRQTLITDCYSLRKMPHANVNNNRTAISIIATSQLQQQNVLHLPKPVHSVVSLTSSNPVPTSATNGDSVQAESSTISLKSEATDEQTPQLV